MHLSNRHISLIQINNKCARGGKQSPPLKENVLQFACLVLDAVQTQRGKLLGVKKTAGAHFQYFLPRPVGNSIGG